MSGTLEWGGPLRRRRWPQRLLLLLLAASVMAAVFAWRYTLVELTGFRFSGAVISDGRGVFGLADYRVKHQAQVIAGIGNDLQTSKTSAVIDLKKRKILGIAPRSNPSLHGQTLRGFRPVEHLLHRFPHGTTHYGERALL